MTPTRAPASPAAAADAPGALDRRALIARGAAGGLGLAAALAATAPASAEGEHDHHKSDAKAGDPHAGHHAGPAKYQALIDSAMKCINRGEVCINHCVTSMSTGDTSLKDCLRSVSAMLPMCAALARFGALESTRLAELAKLCIDICADCEKECKKHAEHHAACKACGESCAECIAECKKVI